MKVEEQVVSIASIFYFSIGYLYLIVVMRKKVLVWEYGYYRNDEHESCVSNALDSYNKVFLVVQQARNGFEPLVKCFNNGTPNYLL